MAAPVLTSFAKWCCTIRAKSIIESCEDPRQAMIDLHKKGTFPSLARVADRLSDPYILRRPEARATWRTLREDLGYAP